MEIAGNAVHPPSAPAQSDDARDAARSALSSDFETFLRMLTAQMEYQDPLNPLQSTDFAVQLATFSGVEQQVRTNDLLTGLSAKLATSGMAQLASWIGTEIRTEGEIFFDGSPVELLPNPKQGADTAFLIVRDAAGNVVARNHMPPSQQPLTWAGVDPTGMPYPPGLYRFEVESQLQGDVIGTTPVEHYALVKEVRNEAAGPVLVMGGGATVPIDAVLSVRAASLP